MMHQLLVMSSKGGDQLTEPRAILWLDIPTLLHQSIDMLGTETWLWESLPTVNVVRDVVVADSGVRGSPQTKHLPTHNSIGPLTMI
jgi:hypothetical protein